jgi:hypothetical protein
MDDKLDPFHYMKWEEFVEYKKTDRFSLIDIKRAKALTSINSPTVIKMHHDKSFDPMKMEYRISLLGRKYQDLSNFEKTWLIKKDSESIMEEKLIRLVPSVRLQINYAR